MTKHHACPVYSTQAVSSVHAQLEEVTHRALAILGKALETWTYIIWDCVQDVCLHVP